MKTKAIASANIKTDKLYAKKLVSLLSANLVAEGCVRQATLKEACTDEVQAFFGKARTIVKDKVHTITHKIWINSYLIEH
jgi:hypothetical protein